ncbi:MAG: GPW/gp25 family protein [Bacteroidota bacterium]
MTANDQILGRGWSFPPTFIKEGENIVAPAAGVEDINQSLEILLSTAIGERAMQHRYGCDLSRLIYEPLNATLVAYVADLVTDAILFYEPRIRTENVDITAQETEGRLDISIAYTVVAVNSRFNYVFPYYLTEANSLI